MQFKDYLVIKISNHTKLMSMGFNDKWISWMTICFEAVNFNVLVNEDIVEPIIHGRGLRLGRGGGDCLPIFSLFAWKNFLV